MNPSPSAPTPRTSNTDAKQCNACASLTGEAMEFAAYVHANACVPRMSARRLATDCAVFLLSTQPEIVPMRRDAICDDNNNVCCFVFSFHRLHWEAPVACLSLFPQNKNKKQKQKINKIILCLINLYKFD